MVLNPSSLFIAKNVYKAAYPLHDGDYDYHDKKENSVHMNERRVSLSINIRVGQKKFFAPCIFSECSQIELKSVTPSFQEKNPFV